MGRSGADAQLYPKALFYRMIHQSMMTDHKKVTIMLYEETRTALKSDARILALKDFIFDVYPKRDISFSTSLTTCSICTTQEEDIVGAAIAAFYPEEEYPNWSEKLPTLVYAICEAHATKDSHISAARKFLRDAIDDLLVSNLFNSSDMGELENDA